MLLLIERRQNTPRNHEFCFEMACIAVGLSVKKVIIKKYFFQDAGLKAATPPQNKQKKKKQSGLVHGPTLTQTAQLHQTSAVIML